MSMTETDHHNAGAEATNLTDTNSDESGTVDTSATTTTTSVRKRTRATAEQLSVLEDTFAANVSPNSKLRKELSDRLQMSERSIQIWFQNRRAKVKHVQKRAQMQMQQASIRAQLYHYHQQQYGMQPYGGAPIMPLPQHQQHQQQMYPSRMPLPRSSSMDNPSVHPLPTPPASASSSCTSSASPNASLDPSIPPTHQLSYPSRDTMEFPDYLHGGPLSPSLSPHNVHTLSHPSADSPIVDTSSSSSSSMPSLIAVPDAGPTAMLATPSTSVSSSSSTTDHLVSTPVTSPSCVTDQMTVSPQDIWSASVHQSEQMMRSQSVSIGSSLHTGNQTCSDLPTGHPLERSLSNPPMTTIDPSNLMMNTGIPSVNDTTHQQHQQPQQLQQSHHESVTPSSTTTDTFLNCTTLTIGTWHRLKLRASDLMCAFKNNKTFEWQIEDAGCHFKMEIPLSSVANIDFVPDNNVLADVHIDISESPLFYMETTTTAADGSTSWVQCSDFTEGKQASRFFRHSLKGVAQHLKQGLMTLMDRCPDTRRWIRFVEPPTFPYSSPQQQHPYQQVSMTSYPSQQQQQQQTHYPQYLKQQQQLQQ
ncbi:hypothetical protein BCR42DRAFT_341771, partial [Absidia repens]